MVLGNAVSVLQDGDYERLATRSTFIDSRLSANKSPESKYCSLCLEAQQSLEGSNRFRESLPAGLTDQSFPSVVSNGVVETEQSNTDKKRLQGLGLFILSTLLLSLQATTAKVLGKALFELDFSLSSIKSVSVRFLYVTIHLAVCRQTRCQHACSGNGKKPCNSVWGIHTSYA